MRKVYVPLKTVGLVQSKSYRLLDRWLAANAPKNIHALYKNLWELDHYFWGKEYDLILITLRASVALLKQEGVNVWREEDYGETDH